MIITIEDTLEILSGIKPRMVNIRLDFNERNLIKSLGRQVSNSIALTDRQLELVLKKVEKYRTGLEKNKVDVDLILASQPLRMPLREIDRSQRIYIESDKENSKIHLCLKFNHGKKFNEIWEKTKENLVGELTEFSQIKKISFNEINVHRLLSAFGLEDYEVDEEVIEYHEKIEKILENPKNFAPYIDLDGEKITIKNVNRNCLDFVEKNFNQDQKKSLAVYIDRLKSCGLVYKDPKIIEKINDLEFDEFTKKSLISNVTRFRINSTEHQVDSIITIINNLDQWPLLVIVDEDHRAFDQVRSVYDAVAGLMANEKITVFFRLDNGQNNHKEFNQFVKDKQLNNFIGPETKVVFVPKNKIPKPLLKAEWKPYSALVLSSHDFGKTSAYIDDFSTVYYYNNSVVVRNNRVKGPRPIAQL